MISLRLFAVLVPLLLAACAREAVGPVPDIPQRDLTAFTDVMLVPMTDDGVIAGQTVLVERGRIAAIGPSAEVVVPPGARVIAGQGAYLMPGLADMHVHTREDWHQGAWPVPPTDLYLANGVTTIRDFGPEGRSPTYALRWREKIDRGEMRGPTIYAAGPILRGPVEDPARAVREQKDQGFDFVKLYSFLSAGEFRRAIASAKRLGVYSAGHIPFAVGLDGVLAAGMDEIAHIEELDFEFLEFDRTRRRRPAEWFRYIIDRAAQIYGPADVADLEGLAREKADVVAHVVGGLRAADIPVCTTLLASQTIVVKLLAPERFLARAENAYLPRRYLAAFRRGKEKHQVQFRDHPDFSRIKYALEMHLLSELKQGSVRLLLATDSGTGAMGIVPGFSIHRELRILEESGFTPYEAIRAGTVEASKVVAAMTGRDDFGSVEVGKRADLLLLEANPLAQVANLKTLKGVMAAGRWYPRALLDRLTTL